MSEKLEVLKASATKDEERILKLQEKLKAKRGKIKEMENAEIMNNINSLSAKGFDVKGIISAIGRHNYAALQGLLTDSTSPIAQKSGTGTGSAFQIKEENSDE